MIYISACLKGSGWYITSSRGLNYKLASEHFYLPWSSYTNTPFIYLSHVLRKQGCSNRKTLIIWLANYQRLFNAYFKNPIFKEHWDRWKMTSCDRSVEIPGAQKILTDSWIGWKGLLMFGHFLFKETFRCGLVEVWRL